MSPQTLSSGPIDDVAASSSTATLDRPIPASSGQRRLWFLEQMEPGSPLYNIPYLVRLQGPLDPAALKSALNRIVERHEALRTNFVAVGSEPVQVVQTEWTLDLP